MKGSNKIKNVIIGQALQVKRESISLSRTILAKRLNVKPQFVANWERGQCLPPQNLIPELASQLKMSQKDIINLYTKATKIALEQYFEYINETESVS